MLFRVDGLVKPEVLLGIPNLNQPSLPTSNEQSDIGQVSSQWCRHRNIETALIFYVACITTNRTTFLSERP